MYISKVYIYIHILRYLRLFKVFNWSGKSPLWDASSQANICRVFVWFERYPSGMRLIEEVTVGDVFGRENVCRGRIHRENVRRGYVWKSLALSAF